MFPPITVEEPPAPSISLEIDDDDLGGAKNGDRGLIGEFLPGPWRVKLLSSGTGQSLAGVAIAFSTVSAPAKARGHSISPTATPTDALGKTHAFPKLGNVAGEYVFRARCESCDGTKEVLLSATADPIPTLLAAMPEKSDGSGGLYVSVAGPKKYVLRGSGCFPVTLTATGIPDGGTYTWSTPDPLLPGEFTFNEDSPNEFQLCLRGAARVFPQITVNVQYSFGGQTVPARPFVLTPQAPRCVTRSFFGAMRCSDPPGNFARNGVQFGYRYVVRDQDGEPLQVPPGFLAAQLDLSHDFVITNEGTGDFGPRGDRFFTEHRLLYEREGVYLDRIGQCTHKVFPPGYFWHSTRDVLFDGEKLLQEFVDFKLAAYVDHVTDVGTVTTLPDSEPQECPQ